MIIREWEEYHGGPNTAGRERLHVTLSNRYLLLLNRKAANALGDPQSVMLLYDKRNQAIGVRAAGPSDIQPFPVGQHDGHSHSFVRAHSFCHHYGIRVAESVRFTKPTFDHDQTLILNLQDTVPVEKRNRKAGVEKDD